MLGYLLQTSNRLYLVMEYCAGGDLAAYLARHKRVSEDTARYLMRQLAAGLKELWSHHLVHVSSALHPPLPGLPLVQTLACQALGLRTAV